MTNKYTNQLLTDGTLLKIEHAYSKLKEPQLLDKDKATILLKDRKLLQDIKKAIIDNISVLEELVSASRKSPLRDRLK